MKNLCLAAALIQAVPCAAAIADDFILFDFKDPLVPAAVEARGSRIAQVKNGAETALKLKTSADHAAPCVIFKAKAGKWDLSGYRAVTVDVRNVGGKGAVLALRVEDKPCEDGTWNLNTGWIWLEPGERGVLRQRLIRRMPEGLRLFGMRTYPGCVSDDPEAIDASAIARLVVFVSEPEAGHTFEIERVRATGDSPPLPPAEDFFPFVDEFGQYIHQDWPGKTRSVTDMERNLKAETEDLDAHPGPSEWNRYGGWKRGPSLKGNGHFYPARHKGKWWLVDPDGKLFFSMGVCVVNLWNPTPVNEREAWFRDFPGKDRRFADFFGETSGAVRGYYKDKTIEWFDFWRANLKRKYGDDWRRRFAGLTHRRLRSWGFNTIANWSSPEIYGMKETPYVVAMGVRDEKPLEGSEGFWKQLPDVFDPSFREGIRRSMKEEEGKSAGDPWCIGYFVDNEMSWDDDETAALATLASPPGQAAKKVFLEDLKAKYGTIGRLNRVWGSEYKSWNSLLENREPPDRERAGKDLRAFTRKTAETYFRTCREAVKEVAPNNLYLGCRFAWYGDIAVAAAAEYCDVVSFNLYRKSVAGFRLPGGLDAPVIGGEFHFGALDRGLFDPGMIEVADQEERARAFREHVASALENPQMVGCHWFQYMDQPVTGRPLDGEPAQVGFVDLADTPYPEMAAASRAMGDRIYDLRFR